MNFMLSTDISSTIRKGEQYLLIQWITEKRKEV
jgi:hypothetical protein